MVESVINIIDAERSKLEADLACLDVEIGERLAKRSILQSDLSRLDKAEAALKGQNLTAFKSVKQSDAKQAAIAPTIKMMVLEVLQDNPEGLVALKILERINKTYNRSYKRTSLSPQLTRLANEGKIHKRRKTWIFGPNPFGGLHHGGDVMD